MVATCDFHPSERQPGEVMVAASSCSSKSKSAVVVVPGRPSVVVPMVKAVSSVAATTGTW